jgi:hypothetical protein
MPRQLWPQGENLPCPFVRRLGGPLSRSGRYGEMKIIDPTRSRTPTRLSSCPHPVAIPTTLPRLHSLIGSSYFSILDPETGYTWVPKSLHTNYIHCVHFPMEFVICNHTSFRHYSTYTVMRDLSNYEYDNSILQMMRLEIFIEQVISMYTAM